MRSSRSPTGTFSNLKLPSAPVRAPKLRPGIAASAPAMGSLELTAVTFPSIVPVCAARVTASSENKDATTTATTAPDTLERHKNA